MTSKASSDTLRSAISKRAHNLILFALLLMAIAITYFSQGSNSALITSNRSDLGSVTNPSYGYSYYYDHDLIHKENLYPFKLMDGIKEGRPGEPGAKMSFADKRILYSFAANFFTFFFNARFSFQLLNFLLILLSGFSVYKISRRLFPDQATAYLSVFTLFLSAPITFFAGDLSPHLMSFTFYAVWSYLLIDCWNGTDSKKHLLGMYALLAAWALMYSSVFYAALALMFVAAYRKRWLHILLPPLVTIGSAKLQDQIYFSFGIRFPADIEMDYLQESLGILLNIFIDKPYEFFFHTFREFFNFLIADNPVFIVFAITALFLYSAKYRPLIYVLMLCPIAAAYPFLARAGARGYIVSMLIIPLIPLACNLVINLLRGEKFASSKKRLALLVYLLFSLIFFSFSIKYNFYFVALFCSIPLLAILCSGPSKLARLVTVVSFLVIFGTQFWWNFSHHFNRPYASHAFIYGPLFYDHNLYGTPHARVPFSFETKFIPLTEDLPGIPKSLGGDMNWSEFVEGEDVIIRSAFVSKRKNITSIIREPSYIIDTLFYQSLMLSLLLIMIFSFSANRRTTFILGASVLILFSLASLAGSEKALKKKELFLLDQLITLRGGQTLSGEIELSKTFISKVKSLAKNGEITQIDMLLKMSKLRNASMSLKFFNRKFPALYKNKYTLNNIDFPMLYSTPVDDFLRLVEEYKGKLPFSVSVYGDAKSKLYIGSWLRRELVPNRAIKMETEKLEDLELDWYPCIEIRGRSESGANIIFGI